MSINEDPQRQDKCSDTSGLVNPILVPALGTDDQPGHVVFSAVTKKFDIWQKFDKIWKDICHTSPRWTIQYTKNPVNSSQGNNTPEKNLEASIRRSTHYKYNNYIKQWKFILNI